MLWQFLKKYGKQVHFRDFSGKTAAIDASCWLHKALSVSMCQNGKVRFSEVYYNHGLYVSSIVLLRSYCPLRCGDIFRTHLCAVKGNGITPFVVFHGLPLPAKASEGERRQRLEKHSI